MKRLVRFEPMLNAYVIMEENEFFMIDKDGLSELAADQVDEYVVVENVNCPNNVYSMPLKVQIQTTNQCNLRCITCAVANDMACDNRILTDAEIFNLLDTLAKYGVLDIEWSGGEPLLRKNFLKFIEYAANLGISQNLLTNGLLFNEKNVEIIEKNFFRVQISLDGVNQTYNKIVGKKAWDKFVRSMELAVSAGVQKKIVIATVLQDENVAQMNSIIEFCALHMLPRVRISMQVPIGRSSTLTWQKYSLLIDNFRQQWDNLKKKTNNTGVIIDSFLEKEICEDDSVPDVGYIVSPYGYSFLYINARGDIFPFPFLTSPELRLGSIKEDDLRDIWFNSPVLNYLRKQTYKNTGCNDCRFECSFAERSLVYAYTGRLNAPALYHPECKERR